MPLSLRCRQSPWPCPHNRWGQCIYDDYRAGICTVSDDFHYLEVTLQKRDDGWHEPWKPIRFVCERGQAYRTNEMEWVCEHGYIWAMDLVGGAPSFHIGTDKPYWQFISAVFDKDRVYRYTLKRDFQCGNGACIFICLNPSTADENTDDNTVRRAMNYAKDWGYRSFYMGNLYAYRSTDRRKMKTQGHKAVGDYNQTWLKELVKFGNQDGNIVVAAWGSDGDVFGGASWILDYVKQSGYKMYYLRLNKGGEPAHPLYLPKTLTPVLWDFD